MWYVYLNRSQPYLRSFRSHNLWLDQYSKKIRAPRVHAFHVGILKRLAKSYATTRVVSFFWGLTMISFGRFLFNFSKAPEKEAQEREMQSRLYTIFQKNKYGYHTKIMSDLDMLLEALLNEQFINDSIAYYDDAYTSKEIEDIEQGLNGDMT